MTAARFVEHQPPPLGVANVRHALRLSDLAFGSLRRIGAQRLQLVAVGDLRRDADAFVLRQEEEINGRRDVYARILGIVRYVHEDRRHRKQRLGHPYLFFDIPLQQRRRIRARQLDDSGSIQTHHPESVGGYRLRVVLRRKSAAKDRRRRKEKRSEGEFEFHGRVHYLFYRVNINIFSRKTTMPRHFHGPYDALTSERPNHTIAKPKRKLSPTYNPSDIQWRCCSIRYMSSAKRGEGGEAAAESRD